MPLFALNRKLSHCLMLLSILVFQALTVSNLYLASKDFIARLLSQRYIRKICHIFKSLQRNVADTVHFLPDRSSFSILNE